MINHAELDFSDLQVTDEDSQRGTPLPEILEHVTDQPISRPASSTIAEAKLFSDEGGQDDGDQNSDEVNHVAEQENLFRQEIVFSTGVPEFLDRSRRDADVGQISGGEAIHVSGGEAVISSELGFSLDPTASDPQIDLLPGSSPHQILLFPPESGNNPRPHARPNALQSHYSSRELLARQPESAPASDAVKKASSFLSMENALGDVKEELLSKQATPPHTQIGKEISSRTSRNIEGTEGIASVGQSVHTDRIPDEGEGSIVTTPSRKPRRSSKEVSEWVHNAMTAFAGRNSLEPQRSHCSGESQKSSENFAMHRDSSNDSTAGKSKNPFSHSIANLKRTVASFISRQRINSGDISSQLNHDSSTVFNLQPSDEPASSAPARTKALWARATWYAAQEAERNQRAADQSVGLHMEGAEGNSFERIPTSGGRFVPTISLTSSSAARSGHIALMKTVRNSSSFVGLMLVLTLYALYVPNIYYLAAEYSESADKALDATTFLVAIFFVIELCIACTAEPYFLSFMFWLDLIALVSFIPTILWLLSGVDVLSALGAATISRSGRAARAGARAARVVRVVGLLRRFLRKEQKSNSQDEDPSKHGAESIQVSKFGQDVEESIAKLLICVVGVMLILALLSDSVVSHDLVVASDDLNNLVRVYVDVFERNATRSEFIRFVDGYVTERNQGASKVLYIELDGKVVHGSKGSLDAVRRFPKEFAQEFFDSSRKVGLGACSLALHDREKVLSTYWFDIVLVTVVILIFASASLSFSEYLRRELIHPMERMLEKVQSFANDPLQPLKKRSVSRHREVVTIENSLVQFGNLLQSAFGEAGAKVISTCLRSRSDLMDHHAGKIVKAFFGFCDIRNFTELTEVLQQEVVKMVNCVAVLVHEAVCQSDGAPNKNIGDAFLLVWKPKGTSSASEVADASLRSYIRIIIEVSRNKMLAKCAKSPEIQDRLPGFRVKLGFGLHFGWAIECVIGSQRKIDASYLSSHVNLAARLESATKQYGAELLLSVDTYRLLSVKVQSLCRLVDRVAVKGSSRPMEIYTYDVPVIESLGGTLDNDVDLELSGQSHEQFFQVLAPRTSPQWRKQFHDAVNHYLGGEDGKKANWDKSRAMLYKCMEEVPADGPCLALLDFMGKTARAPRNWRGFRALDQK